MKAVSPLVAGVLLVVITVGVSIIVLPFVTEYVEEAAEEASGTSLSTTGCALEALSIDKVWVDTYRNRVRVRAVAGGQSDVVLVEAVGLNAVGGSCVVSQNTTIPIGSQEVVEFECAVYDYDCSDFDRVVLTSACGRTYTYELSPSCTGPTVVLSGNATGIDFNLTQETSNSMVFDIEVEGEGAGYADVTIAVDNASKSVFKNISGTITLLSSCGAEPCVLGRDLSNSEITLRIPIGDPQFFVSSENLTLLNDWWDSNYAHRMPISVANNNATDALASGYALGIALNHSGLVSAGKSLASGDDVRIVWRNASSGGFVELDRVNSSFNAAENTMVWFGLHHDVPAGSSDGSYYLYYDNPSAGAPPDNRTGLFLAYDLKPDGPIQTSFDSHACALLSDGTMKCWGNNGYGQLGDNTTADRHTPISVWADEFGGVLSDVVAMTAGYDYSCALLSNGTVKCWGYAPYGGNNASCGTQPPYDYDKCLTPVTVWADESGGVLSDVVAISGYVEHTCALLSDGTMKCWGTNGYGQLGDGTTTHRYTPVSVLGLSGVLAITTGDAYTCALLSDGTVKCWGNNYNGQLGDNQTCGTSCLTPVSVWADESGGVLSNVVEVASGYEHVCALLSDGTVKCWGRKASGKLGDNNTCGDLYRCLTPTSVWANETGGILSGVVDIDIGDAHSCALLSDGTVKCWGNNRYGQLGDNLSCGTPPYYDCLTPANRVWADETGGILSGVVAISAGERHTCALLSDGTAKCWGNNYNGQLGDNTTIDKYIPVTVWYYNMGGTYDKLRGIHSIADPGSDVYFVRRYFAPEPTTIISETQGYPVI